MSPTTLARSWMPAAPLTPAAPYARAAAALAVVVVGALGGCSRSPSSATPAEPTAQTSAVAPTQDAVAPRVPVAEAAQTGATAAPTAAPAAEQHDAQLVRRIVAAYDVVRLDLAADDFEAAKLHAIDVGMAASAGKMTIYVEIANAARDVTQQTEIAGSRTAFRVLSKRLLGVVHDTPLVAGACSAYRCARSEGYNRWLQISASLGNPYEGRTGADCITAVALEP